MFEKLRNVRNHIDFFIRSRMRFERSLPPSFEVSAAELRFQKEMQEFFTLLQVGDQLKRVQNHWVVCDVGTKNFSIAPVLDEIFLKQNKTVTIHGIEVDAYRRLSNFYTRADYARYFAKKARKAQFHPINFLDFSEVLDVIFLLNPFVSKEPLLAWGLPLPLLKPHEIFQHAQQLLKQKGGFMVLACPSQEELETASEFAKKAGFHLGNISVWEPSSKTLQQKPRYGRLCYSTVEKVSDSGSRGID